MKDEMKQPLISVIVPVYNIIPYLPRCVESLTQQTYRNLEILLVDDGSTDDTPATRSGNRSAFLFTRLRPSG